MEAEKFLNLYDSFWFKFQILNKQRFPSNDDEGSVSSPSETQGPQTTTPKKPDSPQIHFQIHPDPSMSSELGSTTSLTEPPKKTIQEKKKKKKKNRTRMRTGAKRSKSKSLSELEFEEGFLDLLFSEKDREPRFAETIPGLHRLGMENKEDKEKEKKEEEEDKEKERNFVGDGNEGALISRPYLSKAWDVFHFKPKREYQNPLRNWRFPALSDEIDMKYNLLVLGGLILFASTVR